MLTTIISFVLVLGVLVFFHELGHYWVARRNGIVVEEFGLGYPPRLVKLFTYDGTDFTLNMLPLGGFARMKGENAGDMTPGSFNAASRGGRAATLFAGPFMNGMLAILLFAASFMAGFPAMVGIPQITDLAADSTAAALGLQAGDLLLEVSGDEGAVSAIPDFPFTVLQQEETVVDDVSITISRDGEILTLPVTDPVSQQQLLDGVEQIAVLATQITATAPGSPAESAGFQPGDRVYSVNDTVITHEAPLTEVIRANAGNEVTMTVLRDQRWVSILVTPRLDPPPGEGSLGVGIGPISTLATLPLLKALWQGVRSTTEYIRLVLELPVMIVLGRLAPSEAQLSGPVGIAQLVGDAVSVSIDTGLWFPILRLSAVLSAALAITNLLPLPALDGGRLLFIVVETLRGRRINPEREGIVHMVGFVLLLGLLVIVTVQDIRSARESIPWLSLLGQ